MSRGYLIVSIGQYSKMAELLATSIKSTQSTISSVSLITDQKYNNELFDYVISVPTLDPMQIRSQILKLSPYEETVMLDADMIFLEDVSHWWEHFSKHNVLITDKVKTYRNNWVTSRTYRATFDSNDLANCYSAFCYFKKCKETEEFFSLIETIISNWEEFTLKFSPINRQKWPSIDVAMGMACKILDISPFSTLEYPTFTHMKAGCQDWKTHSEDWKIHVGCYTSKDKVRIGPYIQQGILHYVDKELADVLCALF